MANYYIANIGTSGSGTLLDPWGLPDLLVAGTPVTQGIALTTLVAGDTLYFRGGTYHVSGTLNPSYYPYQLLSPTHSGTLSQPITLQAYPGESVTIVLDAGYQSVFGSFIPLLSYIRFLDFIVDISGGTTGAAPAAFYCFGTGIEVGYCEVIGKTMDIIDNFDALRFDQTTNAWIHHCNIHGMIGGASGQNTSGLKTYLATNMLCEDNYFHGNSVGIHDKQKGDGNTYRRNYITDSVFFSFMGNNQGGVAQFSIYDNVMDDLVNLTHLNEHTEVYNNLIRVPGAAFAIVGNTEVYNANIWNNITLSGGGIGAYGDYGVNYIQSGPTAPIEYSNYNVFDGTPMWSFGHNLGPGNDFTFAQWQAEGFDLNSVVDSVGNIFEDTDDYELKTAYLTAGRFGDKVGPRYPISSILDISRYGPSAMMVASGGCLKITCEVGERWMARITTAFATLQNKTACSFSGWLAVDSMDDDGDGLIAVTGSNNPIVIGGNGAIPAGITFTMKNAAGSTNLTYSQTVDLTNGHFFVFAYDGTSSIFYLDGIPVATQAGQGATINLATNLRIGWSDSIHAAIIRLAEFAFYGTKTLSAEEVIEGRDRESTPTELGATNLWTLQGVHGETVTIGSDGLNDSIGSNHFDIFPFATGSAVYDSSTITIKPAVLFMTPRIDPTGLLITIPTYLNRLITLGGPVKPTSVITDPIFEVEGDPVSVVQLPLSGNNCFIMYQFDEPIINGQDVTMSASFGWALTASGPIAGTATDGILSTPLACNNYAEENTDRPDVAHTLKLGYNPIPLGGGRSGVGQAMANWARRIYSRDSGTGVTNWTGVGTVTLFDANNLPATITGAVIGTVENSGNVNNGIDANGIPGTLGTWTLAYGDDTVGVTNDPDTGHMSTINITIGNVVGCTISAPTIVDPGTWDEDDNCWHGIIKSYNITYNGSGPFYPIIQVTLTTIGAGGVISIPILANGQSELGVFPPTYHGSTTSTPVTFEPMAVCPTFIDKAMGAHCLRHMPTQAFMTITGDGNYTKRSELSQRTPTEFLMTNQETVILNVSRIDPVDNPSSFIIDYLEDTVDVPTSTWTDFISSRFLYLITTASPHGLKTGYKYIVAATSAARAAVINWGGITLTGAITTTIQTTFSLSQVINLNGATGSNLSVGTILQIGSATTDEQVVITGISGLDITVTRASHGTTALTKSSGTICYICAEMVAGGILQTAYVVSSTQIFQFQQKLSIPSNIEDPTLLYGQAYSPGACPVFTITKPWLRATMSYGHCAAVTSAMADANPSGRCINWVCIPLMATDDGMTAIFEETFDYTTSLGVDFIFQCSNEVFNGVFNQNMLASILATVAPNPETSGTGFPGGWSEFLASRQHRFTTRAKEAAVIAGIDPDRVIWGHNGHHGGGITQPNNAIAIAYCQTHNLPIRSFWLATYADLGEAIASVMEDTIIGWLPSSTGVTGALATWGLDTTRQLIMSFYRACMEFGPTLGVANFATTLLLSKYNNGISVNGIAPANTNSERAQLCSYEGTTTLPLPSPLPGFPEHAAFSRDLQYNEKWYYTRTAYLQIMQEAAKMYAELMDFPDIDDAVFEFNAGYALIFYVTPADETIGYMYPEYMWQGQEAGYGEDNLMGWDPVTPINHDIVNESVNGQASIDWIASLTGDRTINQTLSLTQTFIEDLISSDEENEEALPTILIQGMLESHFLLTQGYGFDLITDNFLGAMYQIEENTNTYLGPA